MKVITQDKDFFPSQMEEKLQFIRSLGFDGYEIDGKVLLERFAEVSEAVRSTGFPVTSACGDTVVGSVIFPGRKGSRQQRTSERS